MRNIAEHQASVVDHRQRRDRYSVLG